MNYNDLDPSLQLEFRVERPRAVQVYVIFLCVGTGLFNGQVIKVYDY